MSRASCGLFCLVALLAAAAPAHTASISDCAPRVVAVGQGPAVVNSVVESAKFDAQNDGGDGADPSWAERARAEWPWDWWHSLLVAGGVGLVVLVAYGVYYRCVIVPRLLRQARLEAYATQSLAASTTAPASLEIRTR